MDQLSAHLDRGWDLVQKGDLKGARAAARRALAEDKNSPEAHNLLGYVAAQEGEADEALEHYRTAFSLDDGYVDPMLNAAEVLVHPLGEYDEAIALCDEVLEFVEAPDEVADAVLLKFDALLGKDDKRAARKVLDLLPDGPFESPTQEFLIGRAWWESDEHARATPFLEKGVEREPQNPDAWYYLGLSCDERGDWKRAAACFLTAREFDLQGPSMPWSLSKQHFEGTLQKVLKRLSDDEVKHLQDAVMIVADVPGIEVVAEGVDPRLPVLFDGVGSDGDGPLVMRVFVYQRNCERAAGSLEMLEDAMLDEFKAEVAHALEHRAQNTGGAGGGGGVAVRTNAPREKGEGLDEFRPRRPGKGKPN